MPLRPDCRETGNSVCVCFGSKALGLYLLSDSALSHFQETTFQSERLLERRDLQWRLRDSIDIIASDLMVISEEFGSWEDSRRRIDLLCIDRAACLVVRGAEADAGRRFHGSAGGTLCRHGIEDDFPRCRIASFFSVSAGRPMWLRRPYSIS